MHFQFYLNVQYEFKYYSKLNITLEIKNLLNNSIDVLQMQLIYDDGHLFKMIYLIMYDCSVISLGKNLVSGSYESKFYRVFFTGCSKCYEL